MLSPDELARCYDEHAATLHAFALGLTRSDADSFDLLQEVFHRLARRRWLGFLLRNPRAYLMQSVYRLAIDQARRRQTREHYAETAPAPLFAPADDPDEATFREALADALADLPLEQRAVVQLKLWHGLTFAEIAETLGLSPNTAASRYRYGLDKLRTLLRPIYEELQ